MASPAKRAQRVDAEVDADYNTDVSKLDTSVLWRITAMAFRHRARMAVAIVATLCAGGFQLLVPQYLGQAVDQARGLLAGATSGSVDSAAAEAALLTTALLLLAAAIARGVFTMMQNYQGEAVGQLIGYHLRLDYYRKLQSLSMSWHDRVHTGDLMTRGILDIEGVRLWVDTGVLRSILLTVLIGGGAVVLFHNDSDLALVALSFVPIVAVRASIARLKLRDTWIALQDQMSILTKVMEENLGGIRVVRAFAAQAHEMIRYDRISDTALAIASRRVRLFVLSTTQMTFVYFLAMGLTLWVGGAKVIDGTITLGQLTEALAFMLILQMPVRQIGWMINSIARASTCGGRLFNVLDLIPSIADAPDAKPLAVTEGVVRFEGVSFRYPSHAKDERTLSDISFEARPGHMIGIVGPPGAGKTTIAQLIGRYYDVSAGRITIDGQDIREVTLRSLRDAVSIVQQEPFLFTASIDHNVAYGDPWAGRPNIERSAQMAQLHNYVKALPQAYQTLVGERGVSLSGGQRQRLSIARALLPEAKVLVFDDSTAAVDAATERRIREALKGFVADRAVIVIAHRLSSLMHADEILFVEGGRIVERGSHDALMTVPDGRYRQLYDLQARGGEAKTDREGTA
ncbi:putative ATP-binding component of ABC transporter [alpha proteobacterium BAL199]|jgi:ATP-binding cassette, subfamily B, multidrug efflux pump|nr:putative ATP-binding component of ABC transporter [alpha proteobacterium BAL199]